MSTTGKHNPKFSRLAYLSVKRFLRSGRFIEANLIFRTALSQSEFSYKDVNVHLNPKLKGINIEKYLCINELVINNINSCNEVYLLGENGVGKTVVLQALVRGLRRGSLAGETHLDFLQNQEAKFDVYVQDQKLRFEYLNFFAYGTSRFRTGLTKNDF